MADIEKIKVLTDDKEDAVNCEADLYDDTYDYEDDYNNEGIGVKQRYDIRDFKSDVSEMAGSVKDKLSETINKEKIDNFIKDSDYRKAFDQGVNKAKEVLVKPVDLSKKQDGSFNVPAGVLGAAALAALYPLHRSKLISAAGVAAIGAWAVKELGGPTEVKDFVKETASHIQDTFARDKACEKEEESQESIVLNP